MTPTLSADEVARLGERLRAKQPKRRDTTSLGGWVNINPDGPEAATTIETLLAERAACEVRLERARAVVEPFAREGRGEGVAMTADFRAAAAFLAGGRG